MTLKSSTEWQMFLMTLKIYHHRSHLHILNMNHFVPVVLFLSVYVCVKLKQQRICYFPYLIQTMTGWVSVAFLEHVRLIYIEIFTNFIFILYDIIFTTFSPIRFSLTRFRAHGKQNLNKVLFTEAKKKLDTFSSAHI